jgi:hypothetical protein
MRKAIELREVARFRREKARRCADAAASMDLAEDRARLIGYAKYLEEEAVKLEAQVGGPQEH